MGDQDAANSYYYGSIRTLRNLLGSATVALPGGWTGTDRGGVVQEELDVNTVHAKPAPSRRRSRPAIDDIFQRQNGESPAAPDVQTDTSLDAIEVLEDTSSDDLSEKILFQAGTARDPYDTGSEDSIPLLVLCPCNLPEDGQATQIQRVMARLEQYAQAPYLMVLLASPSPSVPLQHLVSYYRSLSGDARRNVKRLWILPASIVTRIAVKLFLNTIVSGKVSRKGKVKLPTSLSELARDIDITQIALPPDVLLHNAKVESKISIPFARQTQPLFGVSLSKTMGDGSLPAVVRDCITHLRNKNNLATPGIFRKVPKMTVLNQLHATYDLGIPVKLEDWPDNAILSASLLKLYLRTLPTPMIPSFFYDRIRRCPEGREQAVAYIRDRFLPGLANDHAEGEAVVTLLAELIRLLSSIASKSVENLMDSHNLAIVIAPVLVRSSSVQNDAEICRLSSADKGGPTFPWSKKQQNGTSKSQSTLGSMLKICIENRDEIFGDPTKEEEGAVLRRSQSSAGSSNSSELAQTPGSMEQSSYFSPSKRSTATIKADKSTLRLLADSPQLDRRTRYKTVKSTASKASVQGLFTPFDKQDGQT